MTPRSSRYSASLRVSIVGAILEKSYEWDFPDLQGMKTWFVLSLAPEIMTAIRKDAKEDETRASLSYGSLVSILALLDTSIRHGHTVEQFVGLLRSSCPLSAKDLVRD